MDIEDCKEGMELECTEGDLPHPLKALNKLVVDEISCTNYGKRSGIIFKGVAGLEWNPEYFKPVEKGINDKFTEQKTIISNINRGDCLRINLTGRTFNIIVSKIFEDKIHYRSLDMTLGECIITVSDLKTGRCKITDVLRKGE